MIRRLITYGLAAFLTASILCAVAAAEGFEEHRSLTYTLGGFNLSESSGTLGRWNEYRDIDQSGATLKLDGFYDRGKWLRGWASLENPGYQDAAGSLHLQAGDYLILNLAVAKTPHYAGLAESSVRERSNLSLSIAPLYRYGATVEYVFEEKDRTEGGKNTSQEWDALSLNFHGRSDWIGANLEIRDSKLRHSQGQYDADGFAIQAAGSRARSWAASFYFDKRDYDANLPSLIAGGIETTQSGFSSRVYLFDHLYLNSSLSKSETDNRRAGGIGLDSTRYEIEAVLRNDLGKAGINYSRKTTDKTNADADEAETDSIEIFAKGQLLDDDITIRASQKTTDRDASGIKSVDFRNANTLAARVKKTEFAATGKISPSFRLSTSTILLDEDFSPFAAVSIRDRQIETRSIAAVWRATDRLTATQDFLDQTLSYRIRGVLAAGDARIGETYRRYSLGLTYRFADESTGGVSYDQARAKIGDYALPNQVSERNVELWYERRLRRNFDLHLSLIHNGYSDRRDAALSGISNLFEIEIKKTIKF